MKTYDIIYADPPWRYDHSFTDSRRIENNYPTMENEEIMALKIPSNKDSVLFLWATAPKLPEALKVMEAWGFNYRTHLIWDKNSIGMGYWFRNQHELLMVGLKGKFSAPPPITKDCLSISRSENRTQFKAKRDQATYFRMVSEGHQVRNVRPAKRNGIVRGRQVGFVGQ